MAKRNCFRAVNLVVNPLVGDKVELKRWVPHDPDDYFEPHRNFPWKGEIIKTEVKITGKTKHMLCTIRRNDSNNQIEKSKSIKVDDHTEKYVFDMLRRL